MNCDETCMEIYEPLIWSGFESRLQTAVEEETELNLQHYCLLLLLHYGIHQLHRKFGTLIMTNQNVSPRMQKKNDIKKIIKNENDDIRQWKFSFRVPGIWFIYLRTASQFECLLTIALQISIQTSPLWSHFSRIASGRCCLATCTTAQIALVTTNSTRCIERISGWTFGYHKLTIDTWVVVVIAVANTISCTLNTRNLKSILSNIYFKWLEHERTSLL